MPIEILEDEQDWFVAQVCEKLNVRRQHVEKACMFGNTAVLDLVHLLYLMDVEDEELDVCVLFAVTSLLHPLGGINSTGDRLQSLFGIVDELQEMKKKKAN